jgi:hypothetical protein
MQITTISFFRFSGWARQLWALSQMGIAPLRLGKVPGLQFFRFLGSGAENGFSIKANFGTYGILAVWESESFAEAFLAKNTVFAAYQRRSTASQTVFLHNTMSHGQWAGKSPFVAERPFELSAPVAVITRATIKTRYLWRFWQKVPSVSKAIEQRPGLRFAIGIGELPLVQQATFSVWDSAKQMIEYAYKGQHHKEVIQQTRALGWYKEELFARFVPYKSEGAGFFVF